jgi:hypothetical protein
MQIRPAACAAPAAIDAIDAIDARTMTSERALRIDWADASTDAPAVLGTREAYAVANARRVCTDVETASTGGPVQPRRAAFGP